MKRSRRCFPFILALAILAPGCKKEALELTPDIAAAGYREFIRTYPYSPSAAYCQYQIAMTFFKKMPKPGRDPSKTIKALAEFKKVVDDYPVSGQAELSREKIRECEERLAFHNAEIGIFYHNRKAYRAAISRLTES